MKIPVLAIEVRFEQDVVLARQRARQIAELLGFGPQDQTRIATAVSEISRNAFQYGGGGRVEFVIERTTPPQRFLICVRDQGPGMADIPAAQAGSGIISAKRLMDDVAIRSAPGQGTEVCLWKDMLPHMPAITGQEAARIAGELVRLTPESPVEELRRQNQELVRMMEELRRHQEELRQVNQDLEDTNRGVLALSTELQDRVEQLKQATELKSRFLSYVSHEFRTPLSSILTLSRILLDRMDGELGPEQEKQVTFIRKAAQDLINLSNDVLNLGRIESGKIPVHPARFEVGQLFSTLRGIMKPLESNPAVDLIFEEPAGLPFLYTDEGKIAQILRNFIANALKFTEQGEIRVSAALDESGTAMVFSVSDTGIGIAPEDQKQIFEEFSQVQTPLHGKNEGTGLGLALSRRLAQLLGGSLTMDSEPGAGSTFAAIIPLAYQGQEEPGQAAPAQMKVLIIDDEEAGRYAFKKLLSDTPYRVIEAGSGQEGIRLALEEQPQVIFLDLVMPGMSGPETLDQLKLDPVTAHIPVIIYSGKELPREERDTLLKSAAALLSKQAISGPALAAEIKAALRRSGPEPGQQQLAEETRYA